MTTPTTAVEAFQQVDRLTRELADLTAHCTNLRRWYSDAMAALDRMRLSRDELQSELSLARVRVAHYRAKFDTSERERRVTDELLTLSRQVREELSDECDRLTADLEELRQENERLRCELDERPDAPVTAEARGGGVATPNR